MVFNDDQKSNMHTECMPWRACSPMYAHAELLAIQKSTFSDLHVLKNVLSWRASDEERAICRMHVLKYVLSWRACAGNPCTLGFARVRRRASTIYLGVPVMNSVLSAECTCWTTCFFRRKYDNKACSLGFARVKRRAIMACQCVLSLGCTCQKTCSYRAVYVLTNPTQADSPLLSRTRERFQ
jgi:hypothetical protein